MKYTNAELILPEYLLKEIQKYVQGEMVYIPTFSTSRRGWGVNSGTKIHLLQRNQSIKDQFEKGTTIDDLAASFYLSIDSVKKIIYKKKT